MTICIWRNLIYNYIIMNNKLLKPKWKDLTEEYNRVMAEEEEMRKEIRMKRNKAK